MGTTVLPCASVILKVLMSEGVNRIWVVTSEMDFGSSPSNTLYSRVTSWGRERAVLFRGSFQRIENRV